MREIKFRAWDESDQCMFYQNDIGEDFDFEIYPNELKLLVNEQYHECGSGVPVELWKYVERKALFMEYTGLKDKNGVEIYEGDIVIMHTEWNGGFNSDDFGEHENIGVASITASRGAVLNKCKKKDIIECEESYKKTWSVNIRGYRSKVIGNIYENPELLECNNERD